MRIHEEGEKAMLIKTNLHEIFKNMLEGNVQITDNSVCDKCSKCGELMMPHRVCKNCGSYNKKEIIPQD